MSDAEALTLADFGFPDEEAVQQAEDACFVGRQAGEMKPAAQKAKSKSIFEAANMPLDSKTLGKESGSGTGYGYTAFRAANPDPDGKKRKGRPVGWRKGLYMKPKTEVSNKPPPPTAAPFQPSETKDDGEDEIKVEPPPVLAPDASLSSDAVIPKPDAKPSPRSPASASTGYAAFRRANPGAKKVGRPVGWKMGVHGTKKKRIEKNLERKKGDMELAKSKDGSNILPSIEKIERRGKREACSFVQADGEISMQLDQGQDKGEKLSFQPSPPSTNFDEFDQGGSLDHEKGDEDSPLPASFWEGVLAAANASSPASVIKQELNIKPDDRSGRRDSPYGSVYSRAPSFVSVNHDSAEEMTQDDGSGSSDVSHFCA